VVLVVDAHLGPWTEEDLLSLPESVQRFELLEGALFVNPPPAVPHQLVSRKLANALSAVATPDLEAVEAIGVRIPDNTVFIPDVLVTFRDAALANRSGVLDAADVVLVAEIMSPGSRTMDRVTKPAVYAQAGIAAYWRVELQNGPIVFAYRLEEGRYVEAGTARPGTMLVLQQPFRLALDPADLRP
jgi:Uma2 family endonuclease